jgi:hypothetical protein
MVFDIGLIVENKVLLLYLEAFFQIKSVNALLKLLLSSFVFLYVAYLVAVVLVFKLFKRLHLLNSVLFN